MKTVDVHRAVAEGNPSGIGKTLHRRLIFIYLVASIAATSSGALFFIFGVDFNAYQRKLVLGLIAPLAALPQIIADIVIIGRQVAPVRGFFEALPGERARGLAERALARTLNLPLYAAGRVVLIHAPVLAIGLTIACWAANRWLDLRLAGWQFALMFATIVVFAAGHAIYEYLAVKAATRAVLPLMRKYVDESKRDELPRVRTLRIRAQLLFVFAFVACVPLVALGFTVLLKLDRLLEQVGLLELGSIEAPLEIWVLLLVVCGSAVALFLAVLLSRDIASSAEGLAEAMRRVERGEVSAQVVVASTDEFAEVARGFNRMTRGLVERERLRDAFGRYVAPEVAEQVMKNGVSMGGGLVDATVLFIDIRGFTSLAEQMKPELVVGLLNRYFAAVSPPIRAEGGFINKFGGDSLLAVFGAPVPSEDHVDCAVRAALGVKDALDRFNAREALSGGTPLRIGIGIHTGEMVAGSVGSPDRMEYTVIGDVVNVAARIQALTKDLGTDLLLSAAVQAKMREPLALRPTPPVSVRGKTGSLVLYMLDAPK